MIVRGMATTQRYLKSVEISSLLLFALLLKNPLPQMLCSCQLVLIGERMRKCQHTPTVAAGRKNIVIIAMTLMD